VSLAIAYRWDAADEEAREGGGALPARAGRGSWKRGLGRRARGRRRTLLRDARRRII